MTTKTGTETRQAIGTFTNDGAWYTAFDDGSSRPAIREELRAAGGLPIIGAAWGEVQPLLAQRAEMLTALRQVATVIGAQLEAGGAVLGSAAVLTQVKAAISRAEGC